MNKSELLHWLDGRYAEWQAFVQQIPAERMEQPGACGAWTMKDVLAHLVGWNRRLAANLEAAQRGEPEPPPPWPAHLHDEDDINAWIQETYQERSLHEILQETEKVHRQIVTSLERLPDDVRIEHIEPAFYLVWVGEQRFHVAEFFDHFRDDHEAELRAWLAETDGLSAAA